VHPFSDGSTTRSQTFRVFRQKALWKNTRSESKENLFEPCRYTVADAELTAGAVGTSRLTLTATYISGNSEMD
jgi:hypothetical protein